MKPKPVQSPRRGSRLGLILMAVAIAAPGTAGLFRVWVNQQTVQIGYQLSQEVKRRSTLRDQTRKLELEYAAERSPERLLRLARSLDFEAPSPDRVIGGSSGASRGR